MKKNIVILGAGISGLATGWFLKKRFGKELKLTLLEKESRVGGWIQTAQVNDYLFELGPHSCRAKGAGRETLALVEALGLQQQVIAPHADAAGRYLYTNSALRKLPNHLWQIPFSKLTSGWLKALWRDRSQPKNEKEDESIHAFFLRRLGKEWTERLIDPFVSGIYAGNCQRLSLKSCFPLFHQWEEQQGSLMRGMWRSPAAPLPSSAFMQKMQRFPLFSFKEGMETLPKSLAVHLKEHIYLGQSVKKLTFEASGIGIVLADGQSLRADELIVTCPTHSLASLLNSHPLLSTRLKELDYATLTLVNIGFSGAVLNQIGFGYLIPSLEGEMALGSIWDSCIFPEQNRFPNQTRLCLMLGGSWHPEVAAWSDREVEEYTLKILQRHLGIRNSPQILHISRAKQAIPQYAIGYQPWKEAIVQSMAQLSPHLHLSGNAWMGVSINDCIRQAEQLAHRIER